MSVTDKKHPRMVHMGDRMYKRVSQIAKEMKISRAEVVRRAVEIVLKDPGVIK
ncbi:hypothetical protein LCGC14_2914180 [marine sediment metagenome]|uniref:Ribbon-helix-helix protein CopG domain-containing protein n=1 Tax=marine sediment metagenome TaxID=412755 RepID=A0A0F8YCK5_9ZZZZ